MSVEYEANGAYGTGTALDRVKIRKIGRTYSVKGFVNKEGVVMPQQTTHAEKPSIVLNGVRIITERDETLDLEGEIVVEVTEKEARIEVN